MKGTVTGCKITGLFAILVAGFCSCAGTQSNNSSAEKERQAWYIKCRGRDYLRLIYGPTYLEQLRTRNLGAKRSLALREFALGVEALQRFVGREPLRRVHECVFGILALESEPVDPRL